MSDIYSVLIQNEKTLNSFNEFRELFFKSIEDKQVGVCKWNEAGKDMDTALPELLKLVDEKEEWRAVIILTEPVEQHHAFEAMAHNPFDFNVEKVYCLEDDENPLIRLTHILGGVPVPEMEFESEKIVEPNKAPRMIFKPIKDIKEEKAYKKLNEKYSYYGKRPSEILMVTLRGKKPNSNMALKMAWEEKKEIDSSDFWKRNTYPSICRFIVYDIEEQGDTQRYSDLFNFWISILLIATNHINANILQAYRLYCVQTVFDKELMQEFFQKMVYRIYGAHQYIENTILYEERIRMEEERQLPKYHVEIPVSLDITRKSEYVIDANDFSLVPDSNNSDVNKWETLKSEVENNLKNAYETGEKKLNASAENARKVSFYPKELIYNLTPYQREDMRKELDYLYGNIIDIQEKLPEQKRMKNKKLNDAAKKVKDAVFCRVKKSTVMTIVAIIAALLIISVIPGIVLSLYQGVGSTLGIVIFCVCILGILVTTEWLELFNQKYKFSQLIADYNENMMYSVGEMYKNADIYSDYISSIISYSRGASFLNALEDKQLEKNSLNSAQKKSLSELEILSQKLKKWCIANYLEVEYAPDYYEEVIIEYVDQHKPIFLNIMEAEEKYPVYINHSGDVLESPFRFIKQLQIVREELYDDARYS